MTGRLLLKNAAAALSLILTLIGCNRQTPYPQRQAPSGVLNSPLSREAGARTFARHCASCHGRPREGRNPRADFFSPPAPDFTEKKYSKADPAYLFWRISKGKTVEPFLSQGSVMPAWGLHFSEEEIWQTVAYLLLRNDSSP